MKPLSFDYLLSKFIKENTLIQATLSNPTHKNLSLPHKISIRPLKNQFQITEYIGKKALHKNYNKELCEKIIKQLLLDHFKQGIFRTGEADWHILVSKKKQIKILKRKATGSLVNMEHNRQKQYILQEGVAIPFLVQLGIMNKEGRIYPHKSHKFRQLNRFLEMVDDILSYFDKKEKIFIVDFGCGKSYLTFALYYFLHDIKNKPIEIVGYDLKEDVIAFCQKTAETLGYSSLHFQVGNIIDQQLKKVDMVITLHACDTATDAALAKAVSWKADVILSVPCCQHELFNQIQCKKLNPILKHGILKERFASLVTDASRVQLLSMIGYKTQILEFIETEHTPKNLLIRATRKKNFSPQKAREEYFQFKQFLHISPSLEKYFLDL